MENSGTKVCPHGIHFDNACGACIPPRGTTAWQAALASRAQVQALVGIDSHGRYWVQNRGRIIDAVTAAGFRIMSNAERCWLEPLPGSRNPLTEGEISAIFEKVTAKFEPCGIGWSTELIRAIEAAHGIVRAGK